jgi:hypothetical protein
MHNRGQAVSKVGLANNLYTLLVGGCGRAILNLEGGIGRGLNIDLQRDDVYDETEEVPEFTLSCLEDLVRRNCFGVQKPVPDGWSYGTAMSRLSSTTVACLTPSTIISAT